MVKLQIPARSAYVAVVRLAVGSLARVEGMDEERIDELKIAVSEACANAVLAHEEAASADPVSVTFAREDDRVIVEVAHGGHELDDPIDLADSQGIPSRLVLSLSLIESLVDAWRYGPAPDGGMLARLELHL
ncbi:MAG: ATP-binding protein [Actinomycetota bacterium]